MREKKRDIRGFPGPEHRISSTPVFIFKFVAMVFFVVVDNIATIFSFLSRRAIDFFKGEGLQVVINQYWFYRDRIRRILREKSPEEIESIEIEEAWQKVESLRRDFFNGKEENLVFGHAGSFSRYGDFLRDAEKFFAYLMHHKKRTREQGEKEVISPREMPGSQHQAS